MDDEIYRAIGADEVAPGVWRWTAYHPEWKQVVACAGIETDVETVWIDPLLEEDAAAEAAVQALADAADRDAPPAIVLTVFYHQRSAARIAQRAEGTTLHVPELGVEHVEARVTHPFRPGDPLPGGLGAHATARADEVVLWHGDSGTLFVGDVLLGQGESGIELCPDSWLPDGVVGADLARSLAPLLDLPIARILPGHGEPVLRAARGRLASALEAAR